MYTDQQKIELLTNQVEQTIRTLRKVRLNCIVDLEAAELIDLKIITAEATLCNIVEADKIPLEIEASTHSVKRTSFPDGDFIEHNGKMKVISRVVKRQAEPSIASKIDKLQKLLTA